MHFKLCHHEKNVKLSPSDCRVVIIGVTSFLGYHAAISLKDTCKILTLENIVNLPSADNSAWLRWKSLVDKELAPTYVHLSDEKALNAMLSKHKPSMIIFVPSSIFNGYHDGNRPLSHQNSHLSDCLSDFVRLLQIIQTNHKTCRIVLFSLSDLSLHSVQRSWLKSFEFALSAYESVYGLKTSFVKVDGVGGPFQNNYGVFNQSGCNNNISEVTKIIPQLFLNDNQCSEHELLPCGNAENGESFVNRSIHKKNNAIFTTYLTGILDPQHPHYFISNSFLLMNPFIKGATKLGLNIVIFHNALSEDFQHRVKQKYENIEFVASDIKGRRTPNDVRFYLYYDYLLSNPTIDHIILTDLRDVQFFNDPFEIMKAMGDQLYVGLDKPWFVDASSQDYIRGVMRQCYGTQEAVSITAKSHPFINAGVIGGSRPTMLSALYKTIELLNKTPKQANCNMGTVNIAFHRYFGHKLFGGYPFQSGFKAEMPGPQGVAIKHKATESWN